MNRALTAVVAALVLPLLALSLGVGAAHRNRQRRLPHPHQRPPGRIVTEHHSVHHGSGGRDRPMGRRTAHQRPHHHRRRRLARRPAAGPSHRPRHSPAGIRATQPPPRRPRLPRPVPAAPLPRLGHPRADPHPHLRRHPLLPGTPKVPGWQRLPLTQAADAVQHSDHPTAYADHQIDSPPASRPHRRARLRGDHRGGATPRQPGLPRRRRRRPTPAAASALPAGYTLPAGTSPQVRTAITWALAQLGTPYSYGGDCTDPHSGNPAHQCDCSSLVQQAYAHAGIRLPRTTRDQVHAGRAVASLAQIQPGDLIFIPGANGTRTRPGHVGLYIGNDLIVQAPRTGANVKITKISAWSPTVAAVRRIRT